MKNYDKILKILDEIKLIEGDWISYWTEEKPNDIRDCYSIEELKIELQHFNDEELENIVFQVNLKDDDYNSYQFFLSEYERLNDNDLLKYYHREHIVEK